MRKENRCSSLRILEKAQEAFCRLTNSRLIASVRSLIDDHHAIQASVSLHTIDHIRILSIGLLNKTTTLERVMLND